MMIIKLAIDATAAIIITMFLSSSAGLELCVIVTDDVKVAVVAVVVVLEVLLTDVLGVCVVDANRGIGSSIKKIFVNIGFKIFNIDWPTYYH